ncbi:hypothetical protein ACFQ61_29935 [Streptomyces sp. NPDC056500]|uniref:hypothetical protein n=1 Tax=Streptomyces sp. NPDC056500 TaxID=3345840 RepID=UPI003679E838
MDPNHRLVREEFPELVTELAALLEATGEHELAICVHDVQLAALCDCGDDFCQSIHTVVREPGVPYGEGHRCVPLLPEQGMLALDVVHHRIQYIEVLHRPPLRRTSTA